MSKRKKEPEGEANFERWLLPYADMITLLLAFFIIMYALTLMEKEKAAKIMEEMSKAFGAAPSSEGQPGLESGGKKFPNPMVQSTGVFKKGTNKKVSYIEDKGKRPTVGNIVNITTVDKTGESVFHGTDDELVAKLKELDMKLLGGKSDRGAKGRGADTERDIILKMGKNKKRGITGEVDLVPAGAGGKKEGDKGGRAPGDKSGDLGGTTAGDKTGDKGGEKAGELSGDKGGETKGESGGDMGDEDGGAGGEDEENNFRYKVKDPYLESIAGKLTSIFSEELKNASLEIKVTQRGIEMVLSGDIMFELGSIEILPQSIKVIEKLCAVLKYLSAFGFNFRVEGHTDNINVHSFLYPSNWELSCARAVAVVRHLTEELSLAPETISAAGCRRFRPIADNSTPEGRKKNRRIEILIYDPLKPLDVSGDLSKKSETYYKEKLEKEKALKNMRLNPASPTGEVTLQSPAGPSTAETATVSGAAGKISSATSEVKINGR